jgi:hypothetical protein
VQGSQNQALRITRVSELPGRVRCAVPGLHGNTALASALAEMVGRQPGIDQVETNPVTGRVLVYFDEHVPPDVIDGYLRAAVLAATATTASTASAAPAPSPAPSALVTGAAIGGVATAVGLMLSLGAGAAVALGAVAFCGWQLVSGQVYHLTPVAAPVRRPRSGDLQMLLRVLAPYRRQIAVAAGLSMFSVLASIGRYGVIGWAINTVIYNRALWLPGGITLAAGGALLALSALALGLIAGYVWLSHQSQVRWARIGRTIPHQLRVQLYTQIQQLELKYFQGHLRGELVATLGEDLNRIESAFDALADLVDACIRSLLLIGPLIFVASQVVGVALVPIPFIVGLSFFLYPRIRELYEKVREQAARLSGQVTSNLDGIATIKSFTIESREVQRIRAVSATYRNRSREAFTLAGRFSVLLEGIVLTSLAIIVLLGGWLVSAGAMTVGSYVVLLMLTGQLF